jgi:polysaccharide chain length determinant protein (PEP-CTERM system associated)
MAKKTVGLADTRFLPLSILYMIWKHKIMCLLTLIALAAGGTAIIYLLPVKYTAQSTILVDSQKIPEKFVTSTVGAPLQDRLMALNQQIMSAPRLRKIIQDFNLYPNERKTKGSEEITDLMRADISLKVEKGWTQNRPGSFHIYYDAPTAALAAAVTNRLASLYIEENLRDREGQAEHTSAFLDTQLNEAKKTLDELEAAVSKYKLEHNGELPEQESTLSSTLARLQIELQGLQDTANRTAQSRILLDTSLHAAETALAALTRPAAVEATSGEPLPAAAEAPAAQKPERKASDVVAAQLELLRRRYSDEHPDVRRMRQELARIKALEADPTSALAAVSARQAADPVSTAVRAPATPRPAPAAPDNSKDVSAARERVDNLKAQIRLSERQLQDLENDRQRVLREIQTHQARLNKLPVREQEMAGLVRDYGIAKANYKSLQEKKLAAEMASDMERRGGSESFTVVEPAEPPANPSKPNRAKLLMLVAMFALAMGLVLPITVEVKRSTVLGEWELPTNLQVLGRIPEFSPRGPTAPSAGKLARVSGFKRWRLALASSALAVIAAAVYIIRSRY